MADDYNEAAETTVTQQGITPPPRTLFDVRALALSIAEQTRNFDALADAEKITANAAVYENFLRNGYTPKKKEPENEGAVFGDRIEGIG